MESVTVLRGPLLEDLRVWAEAHRQTWEMAVRARSEGIVKEMRRRIRVWKKGGALDRGPLEEWSESFPWAGPPGASYYRQAIAFLELADETVVLSERQVSAWVENDWPWTPEWVRICRKLGVV